MSVLIATRPRRPISLTALIDVVFILLMFFMMTSTFTRHHETVLDTAAASEATAAPEPLLLVLSADGRLAALPAGTAIDDAWLQARAIDHSLLVHPRPDTRVQTIVDQMQRLRQLGFSGVNLGATLEP